MPNPHHMLYDGAGRLLISPGDEMTVLSYNNYTGKVYNKLSAYVKNVSDQYDGAHYTINVELADATWLLNTFHVNKNPGMSQLERLFGFDQDADALSKLKDSSFIKNGKLVSSKGTFTYADWFKDFGAADKSFQPGLTNFSGLDVASVATLLLTGENFFTHTFLPENQLTDFTEAIFQYFDTAIPSNDDLNRKVNTSESKPGVSAPKGYQKEFIEASKEMAVKVSVELLKKLGRGETTTGFGYTLSTGYGFTYAGRNKLMLTARNIKNWKDKIQGRAPQPPAYFTKDGFLKILSSGNQTTLNDMAFSAFADTLNRYQGLEDGLSSADKELLTDRRSRKLFIVEPEIVLHTGYQLTFNENQTQYESEYEDIISFIRNMASQAGLYFYLDSFNNWRLESLHCNDFPSAIISEAEIRDWNFNEDVSGYLARMDVTAMPLTGTLAGLASVDQYLRAMSIDFDVLERYGYRSMQKNFSTAKPNPTNGPGGTAIALATAAVMSRRFLDMENGRVLGGSTTMHTNHLIRPNITVYIPTRNMIYTVLAASGNQNMESGTDTTNLSLAYGRRPGHFYEGLLYGLSDVRVTAFNETDKTPQTMINSFATAEADRLSLVDKVREQEFRLWDNNFDNDIEAQIFNLNAASRAQSDFEIMRKVMTIDYKAIKDTAEAEKVNAQNSSDSASGTG